MLPTLFCEAILSCCAPQAWYSFFIRLWSSPESNNSRVIFGLWIVVKLLFLQKTRAEIVYSPILLMLRLPNSIQYFHSLCLFRQYLLTLRYEQCRFSIFLLFFSSCYLAYLQQYRIIFLTAYPYIFNMFKLKLLGILTLI